MSARPPQRHFPAHEDLEGSSDPQRDPLHDPLRDAKLRSKHVLDHIPDRVFAIDEFGPLGIRPCPRG